MPLVSWPAGRGYLQDFPELENDRNSSLSADRIGLLKEQGREN